MRRNPSSSRVSSRLAFRVRRPCACWRSSGTRTAANGTSTGSSRTRRVQSSGPMILLSWFVIGGSTRTLTATLLSGVLTTRLIRRKNVASVARTTSRSHPTITCATYGFGVGRRCALRPLRTPSPSVNAGSSTRRIQRIRRSTCKGAMMRSTTDDTPRPLRRWTGRVASSCRREWRCPTAPGHREPIGSSRVVWSASILQCLGLCMAMLCTGIGAAPACV
mmetsp:Transcript_11187/g.41012  ORF Transcript_11187/g.41012 Transcript_11187/m.41012 type:complete len:220 (-) Transcript_11187:9-668(-)